MTRILRVALVAAIASVLAACGGGGTSQSVLPGGNGTRAPETLSTPPPTLYVAANTLVNAFAPTATGTTPPSRTIYVHPNQPDSIVGLATWTDGVLDILQNHFTQSAPTQRCRIVTVPATANGVTTALQNHDCVENNTDNEVGYGIGRNAVNGGVDILFSDLSNGPHEYVKRFTQAGGGAGTLTLSSFFTAATGSEPYRHFATDRGGHDYYDDTTGHVFKIKHTTTDSNNVGGQSFSTGTATGAMAVSPVDLTLYIVEPGAGPAGVDQIAEFVPADYTGKGGATATPSGPTIVFQAGTKVTALATDHSGNLYVGLTDASGAHVKVYSPGATTSHQNLMPLTNTGSTQITAITLYEPGF